MENNFDLIDLGILADLVDQEKQKVLDEINKNVKFQQEISNFYIEKLQNLNTLSRKIIIVRELRR